MFIATILFIAVLLLCLAVAVAFFGVGRGLFSIYRQSRTRRLAAQGTKALKERQEAEALAWFLKAEASWSLNTHDGHRASLESDLDFLTKIADGIFKIVGLKSGPLRGDLQGIIGEMKSLLHQHPYFSTDVRKTRPELLERWNAMCERLNVIRAELRTVGQPIL